MNSTKRIIKNTFIMYIALALNIAIGLVYARVVLNNLGVEDFGIYSVMGGLVLLFSVLSGTMSGSVQRFLSYALGAKDVLRAKQIFTASIGIHLCLALIILGLGETVGYWFFEKYLVISADRFDAASWIFHTVLVSFVLSMLSVPALGMLNSYEKMGIVAFINLLGPVGRLGAAVVIPFIGYDSLKVFAFLTLVVSLIEMIFAYTVAFLCCPAARPSRLYDKKMCGELVSFASWGFVGDLAGVSKNQGIAIVLNMYHGVFANAALGVANQLVSKIENVSAMIVQAANPQIIKRYAAADHANSIKLVTQSSKICFVLLYVTALPFLLETEFILRVWLKVVPEYSVIFVKLALTTALIDSVSKSLMTLSRATGKIRLYQSVVGSLLLLNLPVSLVFLHNGFSPEIVFYVSMFLASMAFFARLWILKNTAALNVGKFLTEVIVKVCIFVLTSFIVFFFGKKIIFSDFYLKSYNIVIVPVLLFFSAWYCVLVSAERSFIKNIIKEKLNR